MKTFETWLEQEELKNGGMGLSQLEKDQMKLAWDKGQDALIDYHNEQASIASEKFKPGEGCDCGCNEPIATNAKDMLEFLANRFEFAGVSHSVAESYARDIRKILSEM